MPIFHREPDDTQHSALLNLVEFDYKFQHNSLADLSVRHLCWGELREFQIKKYSVHSKSSTVNHQQLQVVVLIFWISLTWIISKNCSAVIALFSSHRVLRPDFFPDDSNNEKAIFGDYQPYAPKECGIHQYKVLGFSKPCSLADSHFP